MATVPSPGIQATTPSSSAMALGWLRGYGLAVLAVAIALGLGVIGDLQGLYRVQTPLLLIAIAVAVWYGGGAPGVVAIVLSALFFNYFFTEPRYSFHIDAVDRAHFVIFVIFAAMIGWFASSRRRVERDLRRARDELRAEVVLRTQQADEIRQLNAALERRTVELEASNKELEAFAYSTSHDLRAPLRHVAGYSELLQKNASASLDEKSRRYVTMILESAQKMGALIDDLLSFSRIGRAEQIHARVDLGELVEDVLRDARDPGGGRRIVWRVGALPTIQGDRSMLRMVIVNLVSNAVKYTRTRETAEIEIGYAEGGADDVVIFVKDNGVGFDMKYVGKLFGVFQRLHRSSLFEGTGIGLATVQRIVARHGGRAWAEGAVDGGATFYFSVPRLRGEA